MKITQEHYDYIKNCIIQVDHEKALAYYEQLKTDNRVKVINKAFVWALFNASVNVKFVCDVLYNYMNDSHIETALLRVGKELYPEIFIKGE